MWFVLKFLGAVVLFVVGGFCLLLLWRDSPWTAGLLVLLGAIGAAMQAKHNKDKRQATRNDDDPPPTA